MQPYVTELRALLDAAVPRLEQIDDAQASRRPAPGKWSPKEIIGHLIDSASNNHQRFVRGQLTEDLVFPGYEQERWVDVQGHASAPWSELVGLWHFYNRQIARVMANASAAERERPRARHNLHEIATYGVPPSEPGTLDYLMADYVKHLRRHVAQIFPDLA